MHECPRADRGPETVKRRDSETDEEVRLHLAMAEEDALHRGQGLRPRRLAKSTWLRAVGRTVSYAHVVGTDAPVNY